MRTYLECVPCFVRQATEASQRLTDDPAVHEQVLRETLRLASAMRFDCPPPWMGQLIHRVLRQILNDPDPYYQAKQHSNLLALSWYPKLKKQVQSSADPFVTAVQLVSAANVIDFASSNQIGDEDLHRAFEEAKETPLDKGAIDDLRRAVESSQDTLYLADNAGEIVIDRLLIEQMPYRRTTLVVRGHPVINDATLEDAEAAGLPSPVSVIDNGSDAPGTILEDCSASFQSRFRQCDLVLAKGQGNYETLNDQAKNIFFLLKVKCPVIARDIGCEVGRIQILGPTNNKEGVLSCESVWPQRKNR